MADRIDDPMLFDWGEFWDADAVQLMSAEEVVAYQRLLSCQWRDGDLPEDPRLLALKASSGVRQFTVEDFVGPGGTLAAPDHGSLWHSIGQCFEVREGVRHPRVEEERVAWLAKKARYSTRGKAARAAQSGKKRASTRKKPARSRQEAGKKTEQARSLSLSPPGPNPIQEEERESLEPGDQTALIEGMETKAPKKTIAEQRAEVAAEVYAYYQIWQPHWASALSQPSPPKTKLTATKIKHIGQFYPDYDADQLKTVVDHVIYSAFNLGQHGGGSEGRPRLTVEDIFKKNGKIDTVELLINKTAADAGMNQAVSQVINQRARWEREQERNPS